jgi:hypothetical protein
MSSKIIKLNSNQLTVKTQNCLSAKLIKSDEALICNKRLKMLYPISSKMAIVTVSNRDKKLIIWNFMEELWENHQYAVENKLDTEFKFMDFYNVGLLSQYLR